MTAVRRLFQDEDFDFATRNLLGGVFAGAADVGEVLTTVDRISDGRARSWVDEWTATADRLLTEDGSTASTAARALRAANYLAAVTGAADRTGEDGLFAATWERHRQAWDAFVDATDLAVERLEIPYEGTTLPGYLFRSGGPDEPRPTLVYNNGSDGSVVGAWVRGISGALARGWNAMTFDGPGQNAALVRQGLHFRPDWEHVVTPIVDALLARPDVDPRRLALVGVSQAGYWVPRAVAFEHRVAAAVADPGVVDVAAVMLAHLPHHLVRLLDAGEREVFDKEMALVLRLAPRVQAMMTWRMRPYGTTSPFDFLTAARAYTLTEDVVGRITCPVLVTDPEHEQFWPGQSRQLYEMLPGPKELVRFTAEEGADGHCEPLAVGLRGERVLDWLERRFG
ncbi:alpha/beta hydrolase family protein [Geodermatophilus sp. URMC 61]|uniref:alpha/beta hydrolase family protein n=1 Tax=Geodermatophilus sp. URMC 61 TaxID=3423411 RepID=UPI00406C0DC6